MQTAAPRAGRDRRCGWVSGPAHFADAGGGTIAVAVDIGDTDATPATLNVGLFLGQLVSPAPGPLFGNLAVRLDDDFPQPLYSALQLNLHRTAGGDEVDTAPDAAHATIVVTNAGPLDLRLTRSASVVAGRITVEDLASKALASGQSIALPAAAGASLSVSRDLVTSNPLPRAELLRYITFDTQTVQQVQHPLTLNAAAFPFAAMGITSMTAQFALADAPAIEIAPLTLSASHPVDYTHARIPVASAITGLRTTVALTLQGAGGARSIALTHDFVAEPILVLTAAALG